jgi:hypothetical protein
MWYLRLDMTKLHVPLSAPQLYADVQPVQKPMHAKVGHAIEATELHTGPFEL